ncbi:hypothetical protein [Kitasatospora sp. MBT63]|uniref:hypothetical protein n=1 Tax=Kitasatospora sp. MBT63 TaxID=1444768 RepID=UPI0005398EDF|nr:hypothetical protein [Kitasatospora sp. MBT63]
MNWFRWAAGGYVALVGTLAALGGIREDAAFHLAAVVLTLPVGVAALVGVYVLHGALTGLGGLFATPTQPDGTDASWLVTAATVGNTALFTGAALVTVLLADRALRRRLRHRRAAAVC